MRAAPPDEAPAARPAALNMPSPQRLGVGLSAAAPAGIDWATVGRQLQTVGATGCHLDPIPEGGYRFTCWLPGAQPGVAQRVEGTAATEAEAARLALDRAAQIKNRRP